MKIKKILLGILLLAGILGMFPLSQVHAQDAAATQNCANFLGQFNIRGDASSNPFAWINPAHYCTIQGFLYWLLQIAFVFAGVIAVLFVVLGGYWYLTSAGNEEQAEKGRKILTNSIVGLVIIIMAFALVRIVINTLKGNLTDTGTITTGTGAGSGATGGGGQQPEVTPPSAGSIQFQGPDKALITGTYRFSAIVSKSAVEYYCKTATAGFTAHPRKADGSGFDTVQSSSVTQGSADYTVTFNISPSSLGYVDQPGEISNKQMAIGFRICGQEAPASLNVPLQNSAPNTNAIAAAARATFTTILAADKKSIQVNINALTSDKQSICGFNPTSSPLAANAIEIFVNGQRVGTENLMDSSSVVEYPQPITSAKSVSVKICNYEIGGGAKTVTP